MRVRPPKWALWICLIWPALAVLELFYGALSGSARFSDSLGIDVAGAILLFAIVGFVVTLDRLAFLCVALVSTLGMIYQVTSPFSSHLGLESDLTSYAVAVVDLIAVVAAIVCFKGPRSGREQTIDLRRMAKRAMAGIFTVTVIAAAGIFATSFFCDMPPGTKAATNEQLTGNWWGIRGGFGGDNPEIRTVRLTINSDGTGNYATGSRLAKGGRNMRWLRRGACLHLSRFATDAYLDDSLCPVVSPDGFKLRAAEGDFFGVSVFYKGVSEEGQKIQEAADKFDRQTPTQQP